MSILLRLWRHAPEIAAAFLFIGIQIQLCRWGLRTAPVRRSAAMRGAAVALGVLLCAWIGFAFFTLLPRGYLALPQSPAVIWLRGGAMAWSLATLGAFVVVLGWRRLPRFSASRRGFVRAAAGTLVAAPFAAVAYGMLVQRDAFRVREVEVGIPGLPRDLDGLRLVQLSDIHLSPFLSERELGRVVDMANELRGQVALVTGDLVTSRGDPLDACLRQLARLRAEAGILGCLGNHEIYAGVEKEATEKGARLGIGFLRMAARGLRFGGATLNVAGVDYQRFGRPYLTGAERLVDAQATNLLLSHNPDVFEVAAAQGYQLTVAGHTHGGQVNIEILNEHLNVARFFTPYIYGLYRQGPSAVWVTRGIGTVGVPVRIGAPPEVVLLRLCAT